MVQRGSLAIPPQVARYSIELPWQANHKFRATILEQKFPDAMPPIR